MRKQIHFLIVALCLVAGLAVAEPERTMEEFYEEQAKKYENMTYTVYVSITSDELPSVESYIKRELRDLEDVQIVDADKGADASLHVLTAQDETVGGDVTGYSMAAVLLGEEAQGLGKLIERLLVRDEQGIIELGERGKEDIETYQKLYIDMLTSRPRDYKQLLLKSGPMESLKRHCAAVVATFDTNVIEFLRFGARDMAKGWRTELKKLKDKDK